MLQIAKDYKPYTPVMPPVDMYGNKPVVRTYPKTEGKGSIGKQCYTLKEVSDQIGLDKSQIQAILHKPAHSLTRYLIATLDDDWIKGYIKAQEILSEVPDEFIAIYRGLSTQNRMRNFCEKHSFNWKYYKDAYWKLKYNENMKPNIMSLTKMYEFVEAYTGG